MTRYIFITGGVVSALGKGLAASSLAALLQAHGYKVRLRKLEPYLNVDPGTMSPYAHGEVYVTDDGSETDLDLGHYERFTRVPAKATDVISTGRIYANILQKERRGDFLGGNVQVVPHVVDEIKNFITYNAHEEDIILAEIGGTVGDIEGLPYLEAIRQLANEVGRDKSLFMHLTLVPYIASAGELKTKPSQHSVKELLRNGIQPDILVCRSDHQLPNDIRRKLALFCNMKPDHVIEAVDVDTIYQVPLNFLAEGLDKIVCQHFGLPVKDELDVSPWQALVDRVRHPKAEVRVAIVGKYVQLSDAYRSLIEALHHAGAANQVRVNIDWVDAEKIEDISAKLNQCDAVLVPGGFGERGVSGKVAAIQWARENKKPFLGICFGMQLAVIEAARHLAGIKEASSTEFGPTPEPLVALMTEWMSGEDVQRRRQGGDLGGTMRLGAYPCHLKPGSLAAQAYGATEISERHRHRYEVNRHYQDKIEETGLVFSGFSPDGQLPEVVERKDHPWFIGVQFHPEFKSRPLEPHPLFVSFIKAGSLKET